MIVQECEDDLDVPAGYFFSWRGNNPRKGLGVLSKQKQAIVSPLMKDEWTYFMPIAFPELGIRLLAVWAYNHRATRFSPIHIGRPIEVLASASDWLSEGRSLVVGDFNNSIIWDKKEGLQNFAAIEMKLSELGFRSAYHSCTGEVFGAETRSTYYHTKSATKPYHIDYCFVHGSLAVDNVSIPEYEHWREASDHVPVIVDLSDG